MVTHPNLDKSAPHQETRDAILDAAEFLLPERGYKKMTIDEIAARAGLGKGTVYLYFESKEDIALSVIDRYNTRLQEKLKKLARCKETPKDRLGKMLLERIMFRFQCVKDHPVATDELLSNLKVQLLERREIYFHAEALIFAEVLIEGRLLKQFEVDEPYELAHSLLIATNALLPFSLSKRQIGEPAQFEQRVKAVKDLLIRGVEKR